MTCQDCINNDTCLLGKVNCKSNIENCCDMFKDRSLFIKLPCKVGDSYYVIQQQCTERGFYDKPRDTDIMDCESYCDKDGKCDRSYYIKENKFYSLSQIVEYYERDILSDRWKRYRKMFHKRDEAEQALKNIGGNNE